MVSIEDLIKSKGFEKKDTIIGYDVYESHGVYILYDPKLKEASYFSNGFRINAEAFLKGLK